MVKLSTDDYIYNYNDIYLTGSPLCIPQWKI